MLDVLCCDCSWMLFVFWGDRCEIHFGGKVLDFIIYIMSIVIRISGLEQQLGKEEQKPKKK